MTLTALLFLCRFPSFANIQLFPTLLYAIASHSILPTGYSRANIDLVLILVFGCLFAILKNSTVARCVSPAILYIF